jgi:hypothetical protein
VALAHVLLEVVFAFTDESTSWNLTNKAFIPNTMASFDVFGEVCPQCEALDAGDTFVRLRMCLTVLTAQDLVIAISSVIAYLTYIFQELGKFLSKVYKRNAQMDLSFFVLLDCSYRIYHLCGKVEMD